jgi:hypothetical protein
MIVNGCEIGGNLSEVMPNSAAGPAMNCAIGITRP